MVFIFFHRRCYLIMLLYVCNYIYNKWSKVRLLSLQHKGGKLLVPLNNGLGFYVRKTRKVVFFSETAVNSLILFSHLPTCKKPEVLWPSANLRLSPSLQCPSPSSVYTCTVLQLYCTFKCTKSNSERDSIMPCAVKSSFKPVYRYISRDQSFILPYLFWQKMVFTLQIGDHFFLNLKCSIRLHDAIGQKKAISHSLSISRDK